MKEQILSVQIKNLEDKMQIVVDNIVKTIKKKIILNNISLQLESGNIYGFVGRNGCGKTMLFRAISGLMHIDSGKIKVDEKILHKDMPIIQNMGIIIENAGLYDEFTGYKNLQMLSKINNKISNEDIKKSLSDVGLNPDDKRTVKKYSLGMKQRLIIAQAIMEKPDILMLDEPTNALDEKGVDIVREIILREKKRGALILLASHNKEDISILTDRVYILENGRIVSDEKALMQKSRVPKGEFKI